MKKKYMLSLAALSVLAVAVGTTAVMAAAPGNSSAAATGRGRINARHEQRNLTEAQKTEINTKAEAVRTALTKGDYTAWMTAEKAINANAPILTKITADNFNKFAEAHRLREQADAIMKELGLNEGPGLGMGRGLGLEKGAAGRGLGLER